MFGFYVPKVVYDTIHYLYAMLGISVLSRGAGKRRSQDGCGRRIRTRQEIRKILQDTP